jgi:hypothetical protein
MRSYAVAALLGGALALGACSSLNVFAGKEEAPVDPNVFPAGYKQEMALTFTRGLVDPTNIRDAEISDPVLRPTGPQEQRYAVCMRANVRDGARRYAGVKERIGWFWGGHLNQLVLAEPGQCTGAVYKPWPELEKYCLAKNCA